MNTNNLGKYRLLRELGRGGMGVVYLAEDTKLRRQVALKVLHPALTLDGNFVERFAHEAQAIALLTHPGIVRIHAFEEIDGSHVIDMEYVDGVSLEQFMQSSVSDTAASVARFALVLDALATCHEHSLIHRDIKPSNVLLGTDGRVMLSDFGLATSCAFATASAATSSCFLGTPKYAPPESWSGEAPSPAGDVYSMGLLLLELLSGKTPFDGNSPLEIMRKILAAPSVPVREMLPNASTELVSLIESMLAPDPANRPANATAVLDRLQAVPEYRPDQKMSRLPRSQHPVIRFTPRTYGIRKFMARFIWLGMAIMATLLLTLGIASRHSYLSSEKLEEFDSPEGLVYESTDIMAAPIATPVQSPDVDTINIVGDFVVFTANAGEWRTLWSWNRVTAETTSIWPSLSLTPEDSIYGNGSYQASAGIVGMLRRGNSSMDLFVTNGSPTHTAVLAHATNVYAERDTLIAANEGLVYFNGIGEASTFGLWATDGTIAGTSHLFGDGVLGVVHWMKFTDSHGYYLATQDSDNVYYAASMDSEARLLDITPGVQVGKGHVLGETLLMEYHTDATGWELMKANPESAGLIPLREFMPGPLNGIEEGRYFNFDGGIVFSAKTPDLGSELWFTDATEEGTRLIADLNPGPAGSDPQRFSVSEGLLYFTAVTRAHGRELWVTDGSKEGTRLLADIAPGVDSANPYALCAIPGGLLFTPHDPERGEELWFTDGTPEGTHLVYEFLSGAAGGEPHGTSLMGEHAYFGAEHPEFGRVLWETDGTPEGTRPIFEQLAGERATLPAPTAWVNALGRTFVVNRTGEHGTELWASNPETGEFRLVADIYPGPNGSHPHDFAEYGGLLYFAADDGIHGVELWRTDGTAEGTLLAADITDGTVGGNPREIQVLPELGLVFIASGSPGRGSGIFRFSTTSGSATLFEGTDARGPDWNPTGLTFDPAPDSAFSISSQNALGDTTIWQYIDGRLKPLPLLGRSE